MTKRWPAAPTVVPAQVSHPGSAWAARASRPRSAGLAGAGWAANARRSRPGRVGARAGRRVGTRAPARGGGQPPAEARAGGTGAARWTGAGLPEAGLPEAGLPEAGLVMGAAAGVGVAMGRDRAAWSGRAGSRRC
jgi:hypothetical protein